MPEDIATAPCAAPNTQNGAWPPKPERSTAYWETVQEAAAEAADVLNRAQAPMIVVDMLAQRHHVDEAVVALLDACGYPCAALMMGKGVVEETHPQYIGLYSGARSRYGMGAGARARGARSEPELTGTSEGRGGRGPVRDRHTADRMCAAALKSRTASCWWART